MNENVMNEVNEMVEAEASVENTNNAENKKNGKDFLIGMACGAAIVPAIYGIVKVVREQITKHKIKKELKERLARQMAEDDDTINVDDDDVTVND